MKSGSSSVKKEWWWWCWRVIICYASLPDSCLHMQSRKQQSQQQFQREVAVKPLDKKSKSCFVRLLLGMWSKSLSKCKKLMNTWSTQPLLSWILPVPSLVLCLLFLRFGEWTIIFAKSLTKGWCCSSSCSNSDHHTSGSSQWSHLSSHLVSSFILIWLQKLLIIIFGGIFWFENLCWAYPIQVLCFCFWGIWWLRWFLLSLVGLY